MDSLHDQHTHSSDFDPAADDLFIEPPKWPKVVGILSIIFGGLASGCGAIGVVFIPFQASLMEEVLADSLNGAPMPPSMDLNPVTISLAVASLILNILLLIAGIMLVNRKPSGRMLHLAYALIFIPIVVFTSYNTYKVQEATADWALANPDNDMARSMQQQADMGLNMGLITALATLAIGLMWPVFCVIWFGVVKTKLSQMTGEPDPHDPLMI